MDILEKIKITKVYLGKSTQTSGNKYQIIINYNNIKTSMIFNDNYLNKSEKKDFICCLILDSMSFENSNSLNDFMREFGYENEKEAKKAYNGCMKQFNKYNKLFTKNEQEQLSKLLENY
jgi:hypothetical protein